MFENIDNYEVTREDYKWFVESIKPNQRRVVEHESEPHIIELYGKTSGKLLCSRHCFEQGEKYYIFQDPDAEESQPPVPKKQLVLKTREEVQAFFNIINKVYNEGEKNGRTIQ